MSDQERSRLPVDDCDVTELPDSVWERDASPGRFYEIDQSEVSRLERRSDMLLSTLRSFIQAAGGELQLVATFPGSRLVHLLVGPEEAHRRGPGGAAAATSVRDG